MKNFFYRMFALFSGKNSVNTPVDVISAQLHEPRPLPLGATEFEEWSERIISGAMVGADKESQKFALCNMIIHLGPTIHMQPDIHFISQLRKAAVNQVADTIRQELHAKIKARTEQQEKDKKEQEALKALEDSVAATEKRIAEGQGQLC